MEDMRKQFEIWANDRPISKLIGWCERDGDGYTHAHYNALWDIWQASRASLVVDIASHTEFEIEHVISPEKEGYSTGWIDGRNYSVKQVLEAGITVKGENSE